MTQTAATTDRFGVPLTGWSLAFDPADDGDCFTRVECDRCGDPFLTEDPDTDTICAACLMPPAEVAALRALRPANPPARETCDKCGFYPIAANLTRCPACTRFYARLDANWNAWLASRTGGDAIAA